MFVRDLLRWFLHHPSGAYIVITAEQLADLKAKVEKLTTDKTEADDATATSNSADHSAAEAVATAAQCKLDEQAADAVVAADVADLVAFVDSLDDPTPTPPVEPSPSV